MPDHAAAVSVRPDLVAELAKLAEATGRSRAEPAEEALAEYPDVRRWQAEGIEQALRAADPGEPAVGHDRVVAGVRSWGMEDELPPVPG